REATICWSRKPAADSRRFGPNSPDPDAPRRRCFRLNHGTNPMTADSMHVSDLPREDGSAAEEPKTQMSCEEALCLLREGKAVQNVVITRLTLQGDFPKDVVLRNCRLVRPVFANARFAGLVDIHSCLLLRATFGKNLVFEKSVRLGGSTLKR